MRIRKAVPYDVEAIHELELACFAHESEQFDEKYISYLIEKPNAIVCVLEDGLKNIVGWAIGVHRAIPVKDRPDIYNGRIFDVGVHPDFTGKGLGKRLCKYIINALKREGAERITLEVAVKNDHAINLYWHLGFKIKRTYRDYYGRGLDAFWMVKE